MLPLPLLLLLMAVGIALLWFSRFQRTGKLLRQPQLAAIAAVEPATGSR